MSADEFEFHNKLREVQAQRVESQKSLDKVRDLLAKADERHRKEPADARKWHRVLENLETSLDLSKKRVDLADMEILRLRRKLEAIQNGNSNDEIASEDEAPPGDSALQSPWSTAVEHPQALNLEEASRLEAQIVSGEVLDGKLEARLELANQLGDNCDSDGTGEVPRRQLALRAAIDKINQRQFDAMSHAEIKLVLACHSLLTRRLEPTVRDQRLKRILNGAVRILQRRKAFLEGD